MQRISPILIWLTTLAFGISFLVYPLIKVLEGFISSYILTFLILSFSELYIYQTALLVSLVLFGFLIYARAPRRALIPLGVSLLYVVFAYVVLNLLANTILSLVPVGGTLFGSRATTTNLIFDLVGYLVPAITAIIGIARLWRVNTPV